MTLGASSPVVFETERLAFREMNQDDFLDLAEMLQNPKVMYAYEHDFSNSDVQQWLDRQIGRYRDYGFGLWAVISKTSGVMVGQAGLTMQPYRNKEIKTCLKSDICSRRSSGTAGMQERQLKAVNDMRLNN